jgi:hypothetical protein
MIPTSGFSSKADLYVPAPTKANPNKIERATFPSDALVWLRERLIAQGMTLDGFQALPQGAVADIAAAMAGPDTQGVPVTQMQEGLVADASNLSPVQ